MEFPTSPTLNQVVTVNNRGWRWNGTAWQATGNLGSLDAAIAPVFAPLQDTTFGTNTTAEHGRNYIPTAPNLTLTLPQGSSSLFAYASAQLPLDGTDGSTTFTDPVGNVTWSAEGTATISTTQSKFGGASLYSPSGGGLRAANNSIFDFGTGDFTIEGWWYFTALGSGKTLITQRDSGIYTSILWMLDGSNFTLYIGNASTWHITGASIAHGMSTNTWYHLALVRYGTSLKVYVNGTSVYSGTLSAGSSVTPANYQFSINGNQTASTSGAACYIDDFRLMKGYAAYTANFTAPTAANTTSSEGAGPFPTAGTTIGLSPGRYATTTTVSANGGLINGAASIAVTGPLCLKYISNSVQWVTVPNTGGGLTAGDALALIIALE